MDATRTPENIIVDEIKMTKPSKKQKTDKSAIEQIATRQSNEAVHALVESETVEKAFRMNAKSFWLTYSALYRGELDHARILSMLMAKGPLAEYSIGCEHHKEDSVADAARDEGGEPRGVDL